MEEIWKEVKDFEGVYWVSTFGRVKNSKGRILKPMSCRTQKYPKYHLTRKDGTMWYVLGHRLVALTFIENPNNYPVVHHVDGNTQNNRVDNLEWCTYKYNTQKMVEAGKHYQFKKGLDNPTGKLTEYQIKGIFRLRELGWSITEIADIVNCSRGHISEIVNEKRRVL